MNVDHGYQDKSLFESYSPVIPQIDNLPQDYFYSTDYDYLTLPEVQLLLTLSDSQISYSFSGLRKTTSLHQHQLSKALKRLKDREFLAKNKNGTYELTDLGSIYTRDLLNDLIRKKAVSLRNNKYYSRRRKLKFIPPIDQRTLTRNFDKRWFGNFRYLYKRETDLKIELCWEDNSNNKLLINIGQNGEVDVEYKSLIPDYSEFYQVTHWIMNDISNQNDVTVQMVDHELDESVDKVPYN